MIEHGFVKMTLFTHIFKLTCEDGFAVQKEQPILRARFDRATFPAEHIATTYIRSHVRISFDVYKCVQYISPFSLGKLGLFSAFNGFHHPLHLSSVKSQ